MKNIQLFNESCAVVFTKLYETFPLPMDFDQREIGFYSRESISDESNLKRRILHETLVFLKKEGFIDFEFNPEGNVKVIGARLTTKGLTKLQRTPKGVQQDEKPLIDQLKEAFRSAGDKATGAAFSVSISRILSLIFS